MRLKESDHWRGKRASRDDITDDVIEYALIFSPAILDKHWRGCSNAVCRIPPSGRRLKVVYRRVEGKVKIVTAFWLR